MIKHKNKKLSRLTVKINREKLYRMLVNDGMIFQWKMSEMISRLFH